METPPKTAVLLALLFEVFFLSAVAVPVTKRDQCARHCTESNRFQYSPGSTYTYDYETTTTTMLSSTSDEKSKLQMRAQVDMEVLSKCEFSMRLRGVTLKQTDPYNVNHLVPVKGGRDFSRSIERRILRFSFQDGVVQEICPGEDAEPWITNIQRGVLSALQNSMRNLEGNERLIETDVSGSCPVEYQSLGRSWTGVLTIKKIKDLNTCTDRENSQTSLQGTPFSHGSSINSRPLLAGQQECEQNVGRGILQSSSCTELLVFRPFSREGSGATTVVTQKLTYAAVGQKSFTGNDYRLLREHLLYNHEKSATTGSAIQDAERALQSLCEASETEITTSVPAKFADFVYNLRKLDYSALTSMYSRAGEICPSGKSRKFFLDALPIVSTPYAVKLMSDMVSRQEVSTSEANFWFTSMSFVSTPSKEMIKYLAPLLDGKHDQAYLGVSSLVHTFCMKNDCTRISEVRDVVYKLFENLGENCYNPDIRKILLTLKSIGNIGIAYGREKILERCATNPQLKIEVRLAAIQAFRRFSCDIPRDMFLLTYTNYKERTEIRIASYLAVMACPSADNLQIVKETLTNEQVNQVGSFVWTHLNALAKSKHPDRQDIREMMSNLYLLNKYNSDLRKFSSAHEASFYLESLDSGVHVDSQLVFPTHSFLPHSAMMNLTVDIFGHSCNLLQLDGRMEGIEKVMERFFGPSGYFPQKDISKLLRGKRSISDNKIETMDREFDVGSEFDEKPYGSLDVKIFGNSLWFSQFEEQGQGETSMKLMDIIESLSKDKTYTFSRSFMFLDSTYTIPVTSGLPLRLDLNGTASVRVNVGGRFDVRSFKNVDVHTHVEPSGTVEITGLLTVDAGQTSRTGLRIAGSLHSSSYLDTTVEIENGQIKAVLNMPKDKIDVIDLRSKLYLVHGAGEKESSEPTKLTGYDADKCSGEFLSKILGIEVCTHISLPGGPKNSPMYPMSGAATVGVYIKKTDPKLTQYTFGASYEETKVKNQKVRDAIFSLNTPNSAVDREISLKFHHSEPDNTISFDLKSPVKKFSANANFLYTEKQKKLDLTSSVDDKEILTMKCDLQKTLEGRSSGYFPSMEVSISSRRIFSLAGSLHLDQGQKYSGQLTIKDHTSQAKPITLKGKFERIKQDQHYEGELDLNSDALESNIKWETQLGDGSFARINTEYRLMGGRQYKAGMNVKVRNLSAAALRKYNAILNLHSSAFPEWETAITLDSMSTKGHQENSLFINIGDPARMRVHKIELQEIVRYTGHLWNNTVDTTLRFSYPEKNMNYNLRMKHENTDDKILNSVDLKYQKNKQISTYLYLKYRTEGLRNLRIETKLKYPGREARILTDIGYSGMNEYRWVTGLSWQRGELLNIRFQIKNDSESDRWKYDFESDFTYNNNVPIEIEASLGMRRGQYSAFIHYKPSRENHYRVSGDYSIGPAISHKMTLHAVLNKKLYATEASLQSSGGKFSSSVDVQVDDWRHVSANVEAKQSRSFRTASMEAMWDVDRDRTKRIAVGGELHYKANGYDAKFTTQVQRQMIRGTISTNREGQLFAGVFNSLYKGELEWSHRKKATFTLSNNILLDRKIHRILSALTVTTPYRGYEVMSASVRHADEDMQWSTELSTNIGGEKVYGITSDGKFVANRNEINIDATLGVQTILPGYESMSLNLTHLHNKREFSNIINMNWGYRRTISSEIYSYPKDDGFTNGFRLKTPFTYAEDVSAELSHGTTAGGYKTTGELKWAPGKVSNVVIESRHQFNGRRRICSLDIDAVTPVRGMEAVSWKTTYDNDGISLTTLSQVNWGRCQKMTFGITGSKRFTFFEKNFEGKIHFTSKCLPLEGYDDLQVSTAFKRTPDTLILNLDSKLPRDHSLMMNTEGKTLSLKRIDLNGMMKWKLPIFRSNQKIALNVEHKMENSEVKTVMDITHGKKRSSLLLTGSNKQSYRSRNIEGSLLINTPIRGFDEMKVDIVHTTQDWDFMSRLQTSLNGEGIALVHELNVKDSLNFESNFHMTSYMKGVSNWKAGVSQTCNPGYFLHNSNLQIDNKDALTVNVRYQDKLPTKEVVVRLGTFYKDFESFVMEAEYELGNSELKSKLRTQLNGKDMVSFEGSGKNYRMMSAETQLSLLSNVGGVKRYQMTGRYDVTTPKKTVDLSVEWARERSKILSLSGSFMMNRESPYFDVIIKTPFHVAERLGLSGRAENRRREKSLFLEFEKNSVKTTLTASYEGKPGELIVNAGVTSPFQEARDVRFSAKYKSTDGGINAETFVQLDDSKRASFTTRITLGDRRIDGKVSLTSPFGKYGPYGLDFSGDISGPKKTANLIARWENRKKVEVTAECEVVRGRQGKFAVIVRTPFQNLREMTTDAEYYVGSKELKGKLSLRSEKEEPLYLLSVNYEKNHAFNVELKTPYHPIQTGQLTITMDRTDDECRGRAIMKWEENTIDNSLTITHPRSGPFKLQVEVKTPFSSFDALSFNGQMMMSKRKPFDGQFSLKTPLRILKKLDVSTVLKSEAEVYDVSFKMNTESKNLLLSVQTSKKLQVPFKASFSVDAPFTNFKNLVVKTEVENSESMNGQKAIISVLYPGSEHFIKTEYTQDAENNFIRCSVESPLIKNSKASMQLQSKHITGKKLEVDIKVELFREIHNLATFFEKQSKSGKFGLAVRSPLFSPTEIGGSYSQNRRDNKIEGQVTLATSGKTHKISASYQKDANQAVVDATVESDMIRTNTLRLLAKYVNGNNRDIAFTMTVYGDSQHEIVANIQNYDHQKLVELKVKSSLLPSHSASITGTLKSDGPEAFDGVLTVLVSNKEYRVASSMKRTQWASVEGFLAVNTPHEPLRMMRVDLDYKNDRVRNFDWNLKFKSSHRTYDAFGITMKLNRTQGSEDMSVVLKLPNRQYPVVQLLGNMHYNRDRTALDGRLTVSVAPERYSLYGTYKLQGHRLTFDGEFERNSRKYSLQTQVEWNRKMSIYGQLFTPDRQMYSASCSAISNVNQHSIAVTYRLPWQEPFSMNATLDLSTLNSNFNAIFEASTPFPKYSQIFLRLQNQRSGRTQTFANVEYMLNDYRLFFNLFRRVNSTDSLTTVRVGTPYRSAREFDFTYNGNQAKKSLVIRNNGREISKGELIYSTGMKHASLDMPLLPMTVTATSKYHRSNQEVIVKSNYHSRTMSMKYLLQSDARSSSSEAVLVWDEESGKSLGYSTKLSDISNGQMTGTEVSAKLMFPLRDLELKGRLAKSGRVHSGGIDFYWDARRDKTKHTTLGFERHELLKRDELSSKITITFTHPMLDRDLVYLGTYMVKPNELVSRSEIQYSRQNEQNIVSELRAQRSSRGDQRYTKVELSVRHVASGLQSKLTSELMTSRSEDSVHVSFNHLNRAQKRSVSEIKVTVQKLKKQVDVEMRSDQKQHTLTGLMSNEDDDVTLSLAHKENGQDGFQSRFRYNPVHKSMDFNVTGLGKRGLRMSASFPEDSASFTVSHFSDYSHVTDALVFVGLEKSRVLRSRVNWRPGMWREFRIATGDIVRSTLRCASSMTRSLVNTVCEEHKERQEALSREMKRHFERFTMSVSEDIDAISKDIQVMKNHVWMMYRRNEFYMSDIVQMSQRMYKGIREFYNAAVILTEVMTNIVLEYAEDLYYDIVYKLEDLSTCLKKGYVKFMTDLKTFSNKVTKMTSDLWLSFGDVITNLSYRLSKMAQSALEWMARKIEPMVKSYAPFIIDSYYYIRLKSDMLRESINDVVTRVTESPLYVALSDYWTHIVYTIESFELADITSSLQSRVLIFGERVGFFMQKISDAQLLDLVRNRLPLEYIVRSTLQKGADLYDFLGVNHIMKRIINYGLDHVKNAVLTSGNELLYEFYQMRSSVKYDFDTKRGFFSLEYTLPSPQNSIHDFVSSFRSVNLRRLEEMRNTIMEKYYEDFCVWDAFYAAKNVLRPSTWMPPYDAHAMIAGNQHFVTFDKYSYDFAGECSYLLVRDFLDKNFTVVVNYKKEGQRAVRKSLTITSGDDRIELATDNKVILNDAKVELPVLAGDMVVMKDGASVRLENRKKGFVVSCNLVHDVCTVGMSGYYFGKTGGLFGTYDNEPRLDMMTPKRTLATDVDSFVNSWEITKGPCRKGANMAIFASSDRKVHEKCVAMFGKTTSDFRPCFKQVDPDSYMRMCVSDLSVVNEEGFDSAICTSAAAYFTECNIAGVSLKMPKSCVQCNRYESKDMNEGDITMISGGHNVVHSDVVFVVEEKKCNEQNYKYLGKLAQSIEDNFRQRGFLDVRYRVVGFGGSFPHDEPHIHTMDGQDYGTIRSVESAFQSLEVGDGPTNMLEALRFAASLNYHPGSKKVFVLIKCSTCDVHENRAEYGEVLRTMLDGNVDLHILMEQKYEMRIANKNSKAKKVIGLDKNYAYTLKDAKDPNLEGDGDLQMQLKIPKDICVSLALEVNGSLFDSQYISETRRNTYKKFMDVMARRMAKSAAHRPDWTMCCECIASTDGVGKSVCQKCVPQDLSAVTPYFPEIDNTLTGEDGARGSKRSDKKRRSH